MIDLSKYIRQDYDKKTDKIIRDNTKEPFKLWLDHKHDCNKCEHLCKKNIGGILIDGNKEPIKRIKGLFKVWWCSKMNRDPNPDLWNINNKDCVFKLIKKLEEKKCQKKM